jgi:hypothetical protein
MCPYIVIIIDTEINLRKNAKPFLNFVLFQGQCGGIAYFGDNSCITGSRCSYINDYYSQVFISFHLKLKI